MFFKISLAEWSLNKAIFGNQITNLEFPTIAKKEFGIEIVEYVNTCFFSNGKTFQENGRDANYLKELLLRSDDAGVKNQLIMCDREGDLGDADAKVRQLTIENHYKWVEAAKYLGCETIRVNAAGKGTTSEVAKNAVDGLNKLCEFAQTLNINIIVENHGSYSSDGKWLANVISTVNMPNCGTLPDFGNFCMEYEIPDNYHSKCIKEYDKYLGMEELMPFAKGVSAKAMSFLPNGDEANIDFERMLKIVKSAGFTGIIDIEYEGEQLSEYEGIRATKALLEKYGKILEN
jgi:sugar phosphate isomerase/epimerase